MKRKILKGFTLVELIVTMAIMTILMAAIMQMFKPIRETFVDSTYYESRRTAQNGIVSYISESVRFATDVGIYQVSGLTAENAVTTFAEDYAIAAGLASGSTEYNNAVKMIKENAQVIVINNETDYSFGDYTCRGRLLRRTADSLGHTNTFNEADPDEFRLAMGAAYYGASDYSVTLTANNTSASIGIIVASTAKSGLISRRSDLAAADVVKTNGLVVCKNLEPPINGFYDVHIGAAGINSGTSSAGQNAYIVFLNDRPAGLPDAKGSVAGGTGGGYNPGGGGGAGGGAGGGTQSPQTNPTQPTQSSAPTESQPTQSQPTQPSESESEPQPSESNSGGGSGSYDPNDYTQDQKDAVKKDIQDKIKKAVKVTKHVDTYVYGRGQSWESKQTRDPYYDVEVDLEALGLPKINSKDDFYNMSYDEVKDLLLLHSGMPCGQWCQALHEIANSSSRPEHWDPSVGEYGANVPLDQDIYDAIKNQTKSNDNASIEYNKNADFWMNQGVEPEVIEKEYDG